MSTLDITVPDYKYRPLADITTDLRLLSILPGTHDDPIKLLLCHKSTGDDDPRAVPSDRLDLTELTKTLPAEWYCHENIDGRYVFAQLRGDRWFTSWIHPVDSIPFSWYEIPPPDALQYEALSYTWGSSEKPVTALIADESNISPPQDTLIRHFYEVPVRRNLADALRHLRCTESVRTLWVDALCINQEDEMERSEQVKRMAKIYKNAQKVVIWLGSEEDDSGEAMTALHYLGKQVAVCNSKSWYLPSPDAIELAWFDYREPVLPYDVKTWQAIQKLVKRPWFSRRWIIQESQLANYHSIIQCGQAQMPWGCFMTAAAYMIAYQSPPENIMSVLPAFDKISTSCQSLTWKHVMSKFWYAECEDDRDKVYALLGVSPLQFAQAITPDYSLSAADVYKDALITEIKSSQRLDCLVMCSSVNRKSVGPTWVPDFSVPFPYKATLQNQLSSGYSVWSGEFHVPDRLVVKGVECLTVKSVSAPLAWDMNASLDTAGTWLHSVLNDPHRTFEGSLTDSLIRTLCCDMTHERHPERTYPTFQQWKDYFRNVENANFRGHENHVGQSKPFQPQRWLLDMCAERHDGRSLFLSEDGSVGLCPTNTEPGDTVCVLLGLESPFAVRPDSPTTFKIIGECFISSLLDSVAFLGPLLAPWKVEYHEMQNGSPRYYFVDTSSGLRTFSDPRLDQLEGEWETSQLHPPGVTPLVSATFRNKITGKTQLSDPRLTPETLEKRGVPLRDFILV